MRAFVIDPVGTEMQNGALPFNDSDGRSVCDSSTRVSRVPSFAAHSSREHRSDLGAPASVIDNDRADPPARRSAGRPRHW